MLLGLQDKVFMVPGDGAMVDVHSFMAIPICASLSTANPRSLCAGVKDGPIPAPIAQPVWQARCQTNGSIRLRASQPASSVCKSSRSNDQVIHRQHYALNVHTPAHMETSKCRREQKYATAITVLQCRRRLACLKGH